MKTLKDYINVSEKSDNYRDNSRKYNANGIMIETEEEIKNWRRI